MNIFEIKKAVWGVRPCVETANSCALVDLFVCLFVFSLVIYLVLKKCNLNIIIQV